MKLMLTSKGLANENLILSFLNLLGAKPEDSSVCIITTAATEQKATHPRIVQAKRLFLELGVSRVNFLDAKRMTPPLF